jgi:hypothetical protein
MKVRVRMYRHGLGDCFLLNFGNGAEARHVLIDCGTLGATATPVRIGDVAEDIVSETGGHLHLLIATHEHKDHVSGFRDQKDVFEQLDVDNVWLAWTEEASDPLAQELQKYQGDLISALKLVAPVLEKNGETAAAGGGIRQILGFFGEEALGAKLAKTVQEAMTYVTRKAPQPTFLEPGEKLEPAWLPGVRVYVLGPPRDRAALAQLGEHGSPHFYELAASQARDLAVGAPFFASAESFDSYLAGLEPDGRHQLERLLPFDLRYRLDAGDEAVRVRFPAYQRSEDGWRRVDYDWLDGAADLALQLDGQTNNTSLALAFELIDDGRVLLFPGDAQLGNWLSWHAEGMEWTVPDGPEERRVTAADLLSRTVLYKVGHHASHNATLTGLGLELMTSPDLVAMIPVDRSVAVNKHWSMPARSLYRRLIEKAHGRVVRSDIGWATNQDPDFENLFTTDAWNDWEAAQQQASVAVNKLYVDWPRSDD